MINRPDGCETYGHWLDEWNDNPAAIRTDVCYLLKPEKSRGGVGPTVDNG